MEKYRSKIELHNIDCMEFMKTCKDNQFDLAIVDPEYGRNQDGGINRSGFVTQKNGKKLFVEKGNHYKKKKWDKKPADDSYFKELIRVSKNQIIFGCNYYNIILGKGRIVWDKCNGDSDQSGCELIYNSINERVDLIRYMWSGMMQGKSITQGHIMQGNKKLNEVRIHPTQKPVILYKWILDKYAEKGQSILDTHFGSLSIGLACDELRFDLTACELDKDYFEAGKKRLDLARRQTSLF